MISGEGTPIEVIDEEERKQYSRPDQVYVIDSFYALL